MTTKTQSAYAAAAAKLIDLGYHVVPIEARNKRPAQKVGSTWEMMTEWQRFRDLMPTEIQHEIWSSYSECNIGIVLGSKVGEHEQVIAIDIDLTDHDEIEEVRRALPFTPMAKKGKKGLTLFYRADEEITTRVYRRDDKNILEVLTGRDTRQTVVPPSVHPDGPVYQWLGPGPVPPHNLPLIEADQLAAMEETLEGIGWDRNGHEREKRRERLGIRAVEPGDWDISSPFMDLNQTALTRLADWVPELPSIARLRPARRGYEGVALWRAGGSGAPVEKRKRNLSIQPIGIKDWGTEETFSALDLVMRAFGINLDAAYKWLGSQLGIDDSPAIILREKEGDGIHPDPVSDTEDLEEEGGQRESVEFAGLTPDLCFPPGLVGTIAQWINDSAIKPQPALALAAALCVVGTAMGRQYAGPTRTGSHIYALGIAPTGAGKDHALQATKRILTSAGMGQHLGPGEFISSTAVINFMTRSPLGFCAMDEFGAFMARINSRKAGGFEKAVGAILRTAWGSSFSPMPTPEWAQKRSTLIHAPALSLYGTSTPEEFFGALSGLDTSNGILNRFLIFPSLARPNAVEPRASLDQVPLGIIEGLKLIMHGQGGLVATNLNQSDADPAAFMLKCEWGAGAREMYQAYLTEIETTSDGDPEFAAFHSRAAEYAQRLAFIRAVGRRGGQADVEQEDTAWGITIARHCFSYALEAGRDYIADTEAQARAQDIFRAIKSRRGKISHRDLMRALQHRYSTRDARDALDALHQSGAIEVHEKPNIRGRPTYFYSVP
jgi:hypothetical protein